MTDLSRDTATDFESWMAARQHKLLRTAYLLTGDVHTAEDLTQTTLAKVYLAWDRVSAAQSVDAYARKIMVNEHTSMWRRLWRHRETVTDTSTHDVPVAANEYDGVGAALWDAVTALPERQRAVVVLRYYEQLSEKEAAEALGVSLGTVKSQASRALDTLRSRLGDRTDLAGWEAN
ncbi:SigE family RNA polymerase sigma factor [Nocardioides marmorisolisilvae]|uniref:SigE family RNA polymerase sigma factor n=1 Tax=Nocardioides marmorisolisilvae TaxID=1542737 RepID=UPI001FE42831|nr:SigE family RNA polymerase sigma factor [Nocardioides marmorisolisilvae]